MHHIKYWNRFPDYPHGDCSQWECVKCHLGPFRPSVVCIGEVNKDFRVVSRIMHYKDALALKAKLNMNLNQAAYYCLGYEEVLKIRGWGPSEIDFDHRVCKGDY